MPSSPSSTLFALSAASAAAALSPPSLTAHAFIGTLPCSQLIHQSNLDPIVSAIARLADSPGKSATSHANTPDVRLQGVECCVALHSCSQQGAESVIMCLAHNGAICDRLKEALAMALALEVPCCLSPPWPCRVRFAATRCVAACVLVPTPAHSARPHYDRTPITHPLQIMKPAWFTAEFAAAALAGAPCLEGTMEECALNLLAARLPPQTGTDRPERGPTGGPSQHRLNERRVFSESQTHTDFTYHHLIPPSTSSCNSGRT